MKPTEEQKQLVRNFKENSVKFLLFAPAHSGAEVYWLATYAASGFSWLKPIVATAAFRSPLIRQLEKDSAELQWLRTKTEQAVLEDGPRPYLLPQHVIIAEKERVVKNLRFGSDPPPKVIAKTNHQSVCKPTETFRDPLRYVLDCL